MSSDRWVRLVVVVALSTGGVVGARAALPAQEHGVTPADLELGQQAYLASCGACHGAGGDMAVGVNLASGTFRRATTDQELVDLIRSGIPGTAMPPSNVAPAQAALIVAYLRSLPGRSAAPSSSRLVGNAESGRAIYAGKGQCATCHVAQGAGGFLGPDLSSVGLTRSPDDLATALVDPDAAIRTGGRSVRVVTSDGTAIVGRLLNQDTYSIQLIETTGRLRSLRKADLQQWDVPETSAMPSVSGTLTDQDVADVVAYLMTMQTPPPGGIGRGGRGRGGPR